MQCVYANLCTEKSAVDLTCPIPTHIDEGNLREKSRSQFLGIRHILRNELAKRGFIKRDCWPQSQIKSCHCLLPLLVGHRRVGSAIPPTELPGATLATVAPQVTHRFRRSRNPTCSWWGRFCWSRRSGRSSHRKTQRQTASQTLSKVCPPSPTSSHSFPSVGSSSAISSPQLTHRYTRPRARARKTCTWYNFRPSQSLHRYRINFDVNVNRSDKCHSDRYRDCVNNWFNQKNLERRKRYIYICL